MFRGFVVDASVFSSIIVKDEFCERAKIFISKHRRDELVTLDLAIVETLNVLWKHVYVLKRIPPSALTMLVEASLQLIENSVRTIYESRRYVKRAALKACELGITVYDALYVVLAQDLGYHIATFDNKLINTLRSRGLDIAYIP